MRRGRRSSAVLLAGLGLMAGCQAGAGAGSPDPAVSPTAQPPIEGFTNPVYPSNFPDPMIVAGSDGGYLAFATNGNGSNVQTLLSEDLTSWTQGSDALPQVAAWSTVGKVWAPEVTRQRADRYVMYYTTRAPDPQIQCVGVAVADRAEGPYEDSSTGPLVCEEKAGGSIDAHPFTTQDGTRYLYWKNDGNAVGVDTYISVQKLDAAGTALVGKPRRLFKQTLGWEGSLVEGPFVWENDGRFHLFYSANSYASDAYAVGHAVADSPLGPFSKTEEPILVTNEVAAGPGHCALFEKDGRVWMVYHAWEPGSVNQELPGRTMWLSEVSFGTDGSVSVVPPTVSYPTRP